MNGEKSIGVFGWRVSGGELWRVGYDESEENVYKLLQW